MSKNQRLKKLEKFIKQQVPLKIDKSFNLRREYQNERFVVFESRDECLRYYEWMIFTDSEEEYKAILGYNPAFLQIVVDLEQEKESEMIIRARTRMLRPEID